MTGSDVTLPFGITGSMLLAYMVGVGTFVSVLAAYRGLVMRRQRAGRMEILRRYRVDAHRAGPRSSHRDPAGRGTAPAGILRIWLRYARSLRASQMNGLRSRLLRAGHRSKEAIAVYVLCKLTFPIGLVLVGFVFFYVNSVPLVPPAYRPLVIVLMVLVGFFVPDAIVFNTASKRRLALQKGLPDGLDLLVICAEAGLSLDSALHRVAEEIAPSSPELADELAITSVELNFLPERRMALENLADRIALPAIRGVVNTLIQTERYGTPLSQSLRVLSAEFRDQRMLRAEEKAARLPATLTVPMILFILPTLFIVLVGPAMIDVYDHIAH